MYKIHLCLYIFFIQKSLECLKYLDLSSNEVTKEEGYKEYVIEYFSKTIKLLDGYDSVILTTVFIMLVLNI